MSNQCEHLRPMIGENSDGLLSPKQSAQLDAHLTECAACRTFAQEMRMISQSVAALPRRQTSAAFDTRLAARLAEAQCVAAAKPVWRRAFDGFLVTPRQALRPGLALCSVAAALGFAMFFAPHPPTTTVVATARTDDSAMVAQCIEQHRSEVSAQPLDDWSAQNLTQQLDAKAPAAAPSAISLSEETNL